MVSENGSKRTAVAAYAASTIRQMNLPQERERGFDLEMMHFGRGWRELPSFTPKPC